jgi:hypothetical protein
MSDIAFQANDKIDPVLNGLLQTHSKVSISIIAIIPLKNPHASLSPALRSWQIPESETTFDTDVNVANPVCSVALITNPLSVPPSNSNDSAEITEITTAATENRSRRTVDPSSCKRKDADSKTTTKEKPNCDSVPEIVTIGDSKRNFVADGWDFSEEFMAMIVSFRSMAIAAMRREGRWQRKIETRGKTLSRNHEESTM